MRRNFQELVHTGASKVDQEEGRSHSVAERTKNCYEPQHCCLESVFDPMH